MEKKPIVKLIGIDGNAFSIMGACKKSALKAGWTTDRWLGVRAQMMSGNYDNLLCVATDNFDVR